MCAEEEKLKTKTANKLQTKTANKWEEEEEENKKERKKEEESETLPQRTTTTKKNERIQTKKQNTHTKALERATLKALGLSSARKGY